MAWASSGPCCSNGFLSFLSNNMQWTWDTTNNFITSLKWHYCLILFISIVYCVLKLLFIVFSLYFLVGPLTPDSARRSKDHLGANSGGQRKLAEFLGSLLLPGATRCRSNVKSLTNRLIIETMKLLTWLLVAMILIYRNASYPMTWYKHVSIMCPETPAHVYSNDGITWIHVLLETCRLQGLNSQLPGHKSVLAMMYGNSWDGQL